MNRKNTILIAVLINAGLLSVLLIAALTTQEEVPATSLMGDATARYSKSEESPLFGDSMDLAMRKGAEPIAESPIAIPIPEFVKPLDSSSSAPINAQLQIPAAATSSAAVKDEPIVHKLPSLIPSQIQEPSLSSNPNAAPMAALVQPASIAEVAVKKGDNLEKIAKNHHTTVDEIIKLNQLPSSFLRVGQVLKIPTARNPAASLPKSKAIAAEAKASESGSPEYYTVKVGDNPWTIAMKHHIKVEELLRLNGLNEEKARKLKPGDRLRTR